MEQENITKSAKKKYKPFKSLSKKEKRKRLLLSTLLSLSLLLFLLYRWKDHTEQFARWIPDYPKTDLPTFQSTSQLTQEELDLILAQTGLSSVGLARLEQAKQLDQLPTYQYAFFLEGIETDTQTLDTLSTPLPYLPMLCFKNSPISWEEYILDLEGNRGAYLPMVPLQDGDILLTPNSHSFGWRQGHAAIVIDAEEQLTLESVVLGTNSMTQWSGKWQGFPAVIILQAKDPQVTESAHQLARELLYDVPYNLTIGVLSNKYLSQDKVTGTNCSHLVWQAYEWAGQDIDANGGIQVLPQDMVWSEHLELVQIWGINPETRWNPSF